MPTALDDGARLASSSGPSSLGCSGGSREFETRAMTFDDPELVAREYDDETRFAARRVAFSEFVEG
jgi:hypothetical protein